MRNVLTHYKCPICFDLGLSNYGADLTRDVYGSKILIDLLLILGSWSNFLRFNEYEFGFGSNKNKWGNWGRV